MLQKPTTPRDAATTPRETATTTTYSTSASDSEDTSSIPSSQWSQRRRDLYDSMTPEEQDLFDELQKEIEELRKMLGARDKNAAKKVRLICIDDQHWSKVFQWQISVEYKGFEGLIFSMCFLSAGFHKDFLLSRLMLLRRKLLNCARWSLSDDGKVMRAISGVTGRWVLLIAHWWDLYRCYINSLAPGKFEWHFRYLILQIISVIDGWGIACELALRCMSLDLTDDKSTLVQVMAWCRQAASHYLSQCWPRSMLPYDVTRPQWVD